MLEGRVVDARHVRTARRHAVHGGAAERAQVKPLSRRRVLRGIGATVALPFLDAMVPARARRRPRRAPTSVWSASRWCTAPPAARRSASRRTCGRRRRSAATSIWRRPASRSLEPFRDHLTIVSNTDVDPANPFTATEIGGDHFRSSAVFLTQAHPKQTQGGDVAGRHLARSALRAALRPGHARFRRCSCASRTSIRPAAAATATPASTPTRSAGRRRRGRCR